ncbi:MAG TPA: c-type cytochrome [Phenylobacterium sp.]|jgi:mono/diheme cytochrome c family protein
MSLQRSGLCAAAFALAFSVSATAAPDRPAVPPLPKLDPAQQRGHDFAMRRCSGCHTVGLDDGGAQEGPAFRKLSMRYNALSLEHRFAEVSQHGVDRMPPVAISRSEAQDLVAYFDSLHSN